LFDRDEEQQLRIRLSELLRWVVSQRLAPKVGGGRVLVNEILGSNLRTREAIIHGEDDGRTFYEIIEAQATFGWLTFDQSLREAFHAGTITEETAQLYATNKGRMTRFIDDVNKQRGTVEEKPTGLRLDMDLPTAPARPLDPPVLTGLKLQ
jgi:twitching motility protein PilT